MVKFYLVFVLAICPSGYKEWVKVKDTHDFVEAAKYYDFRLRIITDLQKHGYNDDISFKAFEHYPAETCILTDVKMHSDTCYEHEVE